MELVESYEFESCSQVPLWVYTKGQIPTSDFIFAYFDKYGITLREDDVKQEIIRFVPLGDGSSDYYWMKSKAGHGAFWVTYVDVYRLQYPAKRGRKARKWKIDVETQ